MKFPLEIIESVRASYGYTDREARFLYLVATHSGHFLSRHFLHFTNTARGSVLRDFIAKATRNRHIREAVFSANGARRYHVFSKPLYAALGKVNSAHRRKREISDIVVKLLTLDFVLHHLDADYFDEESDKVGYFHGELGIDQAYLPFRAYKPAIEAKPPTTRYFVDKFPVFIDRHDVLSFVYVDNPLCSTQPFRTHLFQYSPLFSRLPRPFRVCFASAVPGKFPQAERVFRAVVTSDGPALDSELLVGKLKISPASLQSSFASTCRCARSTERRTSISSTVHGFRHSASRLPRRTNNSAYARISPHTRSVRDDFLQVNHSPGCSARRSAGSLL
jgi:hypothetical protein